MSKKRRNAILVGVLSVLLLTLPIGGFGLGILADRSGLFATTGSANMDLFWQAYNTLKKDYNGKLTDQQLMEGAIKGLAESTGDPYTVYLTADELKSLNDELSGNFEGIGAEIGMRDDTITVIAPLDGSPAAKAGLRSGDKILKIDETSTESMTVEQAVNLIRGPKDSAVILTVLREAKQLEITIKRDTILVKSVTSENKNGVGYVKISTFGDTTAQEFSDALTLLDGQNVRGYVIDVRGNPGGYLNTAVEIASHFVAKGKTVVWEKEQDKFTSLPAEATSPIISKPVVVLIDGGSASASEIFAGALKDYKAATLVGQKSFGKGSVQTVENLRTGAIKITIAEWLTPNKTQINKKGITPDTAVELSEADINANKDPQLYKALELIKK